MVEDIWQNFNNYAQQQKVIDQARVSRESLNFAAYSKSSKCGGKNRCKRSSYDSKHSSCLSRPAQTPKLFNEYSTPHMEFEEISAPIVAISKHSSYISDFKMDFIEPTGASAAHEKKKPISELSSQNVNKLVSISVAQPPSKNAIHNYTPQLFRYQVSELSGLVDPEEIDVVTDQDRLIMESVG